MGKITIIVQDVGDATTPMYEKLKEVFDEIDLPTTWDVFIVPADEEWPDLS